MSKMKQWHTQITRNMIVSDASCKEGYGETPGVDLRYHELSFPVDTFTLRVNEDGHAVLILNRDQKGAQGALILGLGRFEEIDTDTFLETE